MTSCAFQSPGFKQSGMNLEAGDKMTCSNRVLRGTCLVDLKIEIYMVKTNYVPFTNTVKIRSMTNSCGIED